MVELKVSPSNYRLELDKMFALQKFGMKFGLDNMQTILDRLGTPHQSLPFIHLAGSNGKGSVGTMLKSILSQGGAAIGFYTSPHLVTFRERIVVGEKMISEEEVLGLSQLVWQACEGLSPPTFFEFVTAMAFLHFKEQKVDLAIIEAGLGGRLDSTNVIDPLLSLITNISLEHTEQLGDSLEKIAFEKAGIIKSKRPVIVGPLTGEAQAIISHVAHTQNAPLSLYGRDFKACEVIMNELGAVEFDYVAADNPKIVKLSPGLKGHHQAENAALAVRAALELAKMNFIGQPSFDFSFVGEKEIKIGLQVASWPGRLERFQAESWPPCGPKSLAPLLLDGAHNPAGTKTLGKALKQLKGATGRIHLLVGVMADKDIAKVLAPLIEVADRLYLTRPAFSRAASPEMLRETLGPIPLVTTLHQTIPMALKAAACEAQKKDLVVLSGSLFTVGEGRAYLTGAGEVESN
ncbi:MAG: bifunctional folylpolyglutamate synthase/dihydrofolate synthase [Candidatus Adiutrix sp.]